MKLNIQLDVEEARRSLGIVEAEVNKGAARAMQRVATTVRKEADQEIRKRLNLKSGVVKENLTIVRPYGTRVLIRDIVASGHPIPLRDYGARQTRRGVTFAVARGPRKLYVRKGRIGFIIDRFGGNVYVATGPNPPGPKNAPIAKVYGPSIPQYFVTRFVRDRMFAIAAARWPIEFEREMRYRSAASGDSE